MTLIMENVEGYVVAWDREYVYVTFTDLFGEGEEYTFPTADAVRIRDALTQAIERQKEG